MSPYDRTPLGEADLQVFLAASPGWTGVDGALAKTFELATFREALRFVNQVADAAEAQDHHPDIDIRYRRVILRVTTHETGGLTSRDTTLARLIDSIARGD